MLVIVGALVGLLGLGLGSFANVVIYRVPAGESVVHPPSACPQCGAAIRARHNVPVVGWLWLRGRCADCRAPISPRYPLFEAAMGVLFVGVTALVGLSWELPLLLALTFFTVVLSAIDFEHHRLPDLVVRWFAVIVVAVIAAWAVWELDWSIALRAAVGALILGAFYGIAWYVHPRGMGYGDVKLAPVIGALLGSLGWAQLAVGGFAAFVWGSVVGLAVMAWRRQAKGVGIPFGPWMFAGAWTGVVVGDAVASWYLEVVGLT